MTLVNYGTASVCMVVCGAANYYRAARRAITSVLQRSDFDIHITAAPSSHLRLQDFNRVRIHAMDRSDLSADRAVPFLSKFDALHNCLQHTASEWILLMDVDTLLVSPITSAQIPEALGEYKLGMVEQSGIRGSTMTRKDFLEYYTTHTLAWFDSNMAAPLLENFRFYNSGIVLGHRSEFSRFLEWALSAVRSNQRIHQVGTDMIADQDYFQFWTNNLHPGSCRTLPWVWNHCEHWDQDFPRKDAVVLHFSNFCKGPNLRQLWRMSYLNRVRGDRARGAG